MLNIVSYLSAMYIFVESAQKKRIPGGGYCMDAILPSPSSNVNFQPTVPEGNSGDCYIGVIDVYNFERQGNALVIGHYRVDDDGWLQITGKSPNLKLNDSLSFPYLILDYTIKYNKQEDAIELYGLKGKMQAHFSTTLCPPDYGENKLSSLDPPPPFGDLYCSDLAILSIEDGVARLQLAGGVSYVALYAEVDKRIPLPMAFGRFAFSLARVDNSTLKLIPDCVPGKAFNLKKAVTPEERKECTLDKIR